MHLHVRPRFPPQSSKQIPPAEFQIFKEFIPRHIDAVLQACGGPTLAETPHVSSPLPLSALFFPHLLCPCCLWLLGALIHGLWMQDSMQNTVKTYAVGMVCCCMYTIHVPSFFFLLLFVNTLVEFMHETCTTNPVFK